MVCPTQVSAVDQARRNLMPLDRYVRT